MAREMYYWPLVVVVAVGFIKQSETNEQASRQAFDGDEPIPQIALADRWQPSTTGHNGPLKLIFKIILSSLLLTTMRKNNARIARITTMAHSACY